MMADDIDTILNQVESQLFRYSNHLLNSARSSRSAVDPLVSELLDDLKPPASPQNDDNVNSTLRLQTSKVTSTIKCFPLLLGAADTPEGLSTLQNQRSCDRLLCTTCDRSIVAMDHSSWAADVDSLFLRQAAVQPTQLQVKLHVHHGARAYACQCHSMTVTQTNQAMPHHLPWVCGKHSHS